jgi:hypothetical protein
MDAQRDRRLKSDQGQSGCCPHLKFATGLRPIVQDSRIEVSAIRPYERGSFWIQSHLAEHSGISERLVQFARKHWPEVDDLLCVVVEDNPNSVRTDVLEGLHTMNRVSHQPFVTGTKGTILERLTNSNR